MHEQKTNPIHRDTKEHNGANKKQRQKANKRQQKQGVKKTESCKCSVLDEPCMEGVYIVKLSNP